MGYLGAEEPTVNGWNTKVSAPLDKSWLYDFLNIFENHIILFLVGT